MTITAMSLRKAANLPSDGKGQHSVPCFLISRRDQGLALYNRNEQQSIYQDTRIATQSRDFKVHLKPVVLCQTHWPPSRKVRTSCCTKCYSDTPTPSPYPSPVCVEEGLVESGCPAPTPR